MNLDALGTGCLCHWLELWQLATQICLSVANGCRASKHFPNVKPNAKSAEQVFRNGSETPLNQRARNVRMTKPLCKQRSLVEIHLPPAVSSPATLVLIYLITVIISSGDRAAGLFSSKEAAAN